MKVIISRYLTREVLNALIAITIVLLLAFLSQQVVRYLNYVTAGKITTDVLLELVSFEIPYLLAMLIPLGLYLGILLAYGRLYTDNEMAILQMCGYGLKRLLRLTSLIGVGVAAVVLFLMLWVNPWVSLKRAYVLSSDIETTRLLDVMIPGRFKASPDGRFVIYIEKLSRDHKRAENVFLAHQKNEVVDNAAQNAWMVVFANEGYQLKDENTGDQFFVTTDGYRYEGTPGQNDYKIIQFKTHAIRLPQTEDRGAHDESETLSTSELWREYDNPKHAGELQWRFSIPILTLLLAILAVPLSRVRPRQGRYLALLPAVLVYIVYFNLLLIARHWVEQGSMPISLGIWWVHGLAAAFIAIIILFSFKPWTKKA